MQLRVLCILKGERKRVNSLEKKEDLANVNLVSDFYELIKVMLDDNLSEFQYVVENDKWNIIQK